MNFLQRKWPLFLLGGVVINFSVVGLASAQLKALETCESCHGGNVVTQVTTYPILHGQKQGYLENQLIAFRDGSRTNEVMSGIVKNLSDHEIQALAEHYSEQKFVKAGKVASDRRGADVRARCVSCHGLSGNTVNTEWPNLQGQNSGYILNQLNSFANGERKSVIMEQIANELTPEQRKLVAVYYDQQSRTE